MRKIFHHPIEKGLERRKIFEAREWQEDKSFGDWILLQYNNTKKSSPCAR